MYMQKNLYMQKNMYMQKNLYSWKYVRWRKWICALIFCNTFIFKKQPHDVNI